MTDLAMGEGATVETLVRRAGSGDEVAFTRLVAAHNPAMARVAYVVCGDVELARDAVQIAWSIAWRRLGGLRDPGQVRSWLVAIAANEARQQVRSRRRHVVVDLSVADGAVDGRSDPGDLIGLVDLERALRRIKPEDRSLLALRFVAGLDSSEIAAQLGISASGVRSRLSRLLDRLRMDLDHV